MAVLRSHSYCLPRGDGVCSGGAIGACAGAREHSLRADPPDLGQASVLPGGRVVAWRGRANRPPAPAHGQRTRDGSDAVGVNGFGRAALRRRPIWSGWRLTVGMRQPVPTCVSKQIFQRCFQATLRMFRHWHSKGVALRLQMIGKARDVFVPTWCRWMSPIREGRSARALVLRCRIRTACARMMVPTLCGATLQLIAERALRGSDTWPARD